MTNTDDTLRKHLDAVDRLERKFKLTTTFAGVVTVGIYFEFFRLASRNDGLGLIFAVVSLSMCIALAANALHLRLAQMTNRILKALELSMRDSQP